MPASKPDIPAIQAAYEAAFAAANGKPCQGLAYERGWFVFRRNGAIDGRYRTADIVAMTARLQQQAKDGPTP